ncbi:hypothetical protein BWD13_12790 [Leptospira santarosai serovar Grippotyphosa]|nr:hypothetical protein BWD13_12790 [Leptospira santarosai serovar Grippotyphosa]
MATTPGRNRRRFQIGQSLYRSLYVVKERYPRSVKRLTSNKSQAIVSLAFFYVSRPGLRASPSLCTSPNLAFEATLSLLGAAVGREA